MEVYAMGYLFIYLTLAREFRSEVGEYGHPAGFAELLPKLSDPCGSSKLFHVVFYCYSRL